MKDQRLGVFRAALDGLIESLNALARVARWNDPAELPPEPLRAAASKLVERLGIADRLSSSAFVGAPTDTTRVNAMCATMKRLDAAYVSYRKHVDRTPDDVLGAAAALESDIADALAAARG